MIVLSLAFALLAEPQVVVADPLAAHPVTEGVKSEWVAWPTGSQMAAVLPRTARGASGSGAAKLSCLVEKTGKLTGCRVIEETPAGVGFGQAALEVSKYILMKQVDADGKPTFGASVVVPIRWTQPR